MKFELLGLISLLQLGSVAAQCSSILPRPNFHKMSDANRIKFINAFKKVNSGPRPTKFDLIAQKHPQHFNVIHNDSRFYSWHRLYLAELEAELMKVDRSVRLPYWDWTAHYNDMDKDPIWKWLGKGGNSSKGNCVTEGSFVDFQSYYYSDPNQAGSAHCSRRESNIPKTFTGTKEDLERNVIDIPSVDAFWKNMEFGSHAAVHNGIRQDFAGKASANDPIFYLHHAFVDKIWNDRQMKYKERFSQYPAGKTDLPGYTKKVQDSFDTKSFCYIYEEDSFKWTQAPQGRMTTFEKQAEPFTPLASANSRPSDEVFLDYAKEYVLKDVLLPSNVTANQVKPGCELLNAREPVSIELIRMMHYNEAEVRKIERTSALMIDEHNRGCIIKN